MGKPGKRITHRQGLKAACQNNRAVICPSSRCWNRPRPASFIANLPYWEVWRLIELGLHIYEKEEKSK